MNNKRSNTVFFTVALLASTIFCILNACSQEVKKDVKAIETKMDAFASKTGSITKFTDYNLTSLKLVYGGAETRIRKFAVGTETRYFYQIENQGKYGSTTASIEFSDLLEVIKALKVLRTGVEKDIANNPDYLENKFVTVDGFQVGYYVSKGKSSWYLKLEKHGSDNTVFVQSADAAENAFTEAKIKIEELKK